MKKTLLLVVCALFFYTGMAPFCLSKTDSFSLNKISWELPFNPAWTVDALAPNPEILNQKFHYLKSGGQSFAFVSEDGDYVLKLFKNYLAWPRSLFIQATKREKLLRKRDRDFYSYRIAFEELKEESGILYLHLNKTEGQLPIVTIRDKLGIEHSFALDKQPFLLQKKGDLVYTHLDELMQKGAINEAKEALSSLLYLLSTRLSKGIFDEDAKIHRNCGFIGKKPIFIDVGRFRKSAQVQTLKKMTERLKTWLHEHYPELEDHLNDALENA